MSENAITTKSETTYSFSRITCFEQCPRQFRYRYRDEVKEAFNSIEAFMGSRVHDTLEWLFNQKSSGLAPTVEEAVGRYCKVWDEALAAAPRPVRVIKRNTQAEEYRRRGADMVSEFFRSRFVTDTFTTEATELHVTVELDGRYFFQGFIDRLARDDKGLLHIIDYKTGKRVPSRFEGKNADQLRSYAVALFAQTDSRELALDLYFLRQDKLISSSIGRDEARGMEESLCGRIKALEESTVFPPNPSVLCDWCGYNDICEAAGSGGWRPGSRD